MAGADATVPTGVVVACQRAHGHRWDGGGVADSVPHQDRGGQNDRPRQRRRPHAGRQVLRDAHHRPDLRRGRLDVQEGRVLFGRRASQSEGFTLFFIELI